MSGHSNKTNDFFFFLYVCLQLLITMVKSHFIAVVCRNQALSHYTSFLSFCSASAFSFFTPACTTPNAAIHYGGECMQHVECNKCVFISTRLIYSLLSWRRERRTTICIGVWRNELDVSNHAVFLKYDPFYHYIVTVFVSFWLVCVFVHPYQAKQSLCGAGIRGLNTKMGWKPEIAADLCEGCATWSKCIILVIRPRPMIKMEKKYFFCVLRRKCASKKALVRCVCFCH